MYNDIFGHKLVSWYKDAHRKLPWRETRDPYRIWLSEIILQQTRVAQGLPYYLKFVAAYPDVTSMAAASEKDILHLWQGLGYYSRARNMHATARAIAEEYEGKFPDNYAGLIRLKGIGDYTASAIASFAFDEQTTVVDGNVYRVLSRYYGIDNDITTPSSKQVFKEAARRTMPEGQAAIFNQAIMEFGAIQCAPANPACSKCIVNTSCFAFARNAQNTFPVKTKKTKVKKRHIHYLVITFGKEIALKERTGNDIWRGLYDFYATETDSDSITNWPSSLPEGFEKVVPEHYQGPVKHILSHQHLVLNYWILPLSSRKELPPQLQWYDFEKVKDLPKPLPINTFLRDFL